MKLSTKARYGLKIMCYLAAHEGESAQPLSTIATAVDASDKYVEQIIMALRKADLIKATRGAFGGYFVENAASISVGEILRTLEDGLQIVDCVGEDGVCPKKEQCQTHVVWEKLYVQINEFLDKMMLTSIINK